MDLPLLLATDGAVLELSWTAILVTVGTALFGSGGAVRVLWAYWTKREKEKTNAWKKVVADKDKLITAKDARIAAVITAKDLKVEELSKEISKKSDEHAKKIEELMGVTLDKVEGWGEKQEKLLDRALTVQAEFTAEVRKLKLEPRSDIGGT